MTNSSPAAKPILAAKPKTYTHSILGGTFDHLHSGHEKFIGAAFADSERVTIGLTSESFSKTKDFFYSIEPYVVREKALVSFLEKRGFLKRSKIIEINDPFGTSLSDTSISAVFVTSHGLGNANLINKKRSEKGLKKLTISKVTFLKGADGKIISSTRIRSGEIDRKGLSYLKLFKNTLILPESVKVKVSKYPKGKLIKDLSEIKKELQEAKHIIAVGDVTSEELTNLGITPNISIIDLRSERKLTGRLIKFTKETINKAGTINKLAVKEVKSSLNKSDEVIKIEGEEDLLAIPAAALAPLGSFILYGKPGSGVVVVKVTEGTKDEVRKLLEKFES